MTEVTSTDRLLIGLWTADDLPDAITLWGDPDVMALIDQRGGLAPAQVKEKLSEEIQRQNKYGIQYWKVVARNNGEFVGCCGLRENRFDGNAPRELGFHIVRSQWGKGYASEAARGAVCYAFETLHLPALTAGHHPENAASRAVLLKLGFRRVGDQLYAPTGLYHPTYELMNPVARK